MLKSIAIQGALFGLTIGSALAGCPNVPHTFTNGTSANAILVNENFNNVTGCAAPNADPHFTGYVGVGTTTPTAKIDVVGDAWDMEANIAARSTISQGVRFSLINSNAKWTISNWGLGSGMFVIAQDANPVFSISPTGNVGIGTFNPAYALHVPTGSIAALNYVTLSDGRLKRNIVPVHYGVDTVMKLKPVEFSWRDQSQGMPKSTQIGFVAQDVLTVVPDIVSKSGDADGTLGVAYTELVPILVKAIQEQQGQIDDLKKQLARP